MAFLHHRVVSGVAPADFNQRMYDIQLRAALLRPEVVLPPAQPPAMIGGYGGPPPGGGPPQALPPGPDQWSPIPGQTWPPPGSGPPSS